MSLGREQRESLGRAVLEKLAMMKIPCAILAVDESHVHALIRAGGIDAVRVFGRAKQFSSHRMRKDFPGKLWGASSHAVRIRNLGHMSATVSYIRKHRTRGAWVWEWSEGLARMGLVGLSDGEAGPPS
ncbi:MAG: hypothetical protein EA376_11395 [Phycisphaeraceae bacterium]|nr:MAG: hypothetical protein EA376_11395 [Phycisphaeraceae bacterium]